MRKILIVDDEDDIRFLIQGIIEDEGFEVLTASNCKQAYELIETEDIDLVVQDIWLQGSVHDGIQILQNTQAKYPELPFLMISGHGTIETAVSSIKFGAYDFIEKPFKSDRLILMIDRALENADLKRLNKALKIQTHHKIDNLSYALPENVQKALARAAKTNSRILITGEVGSGKAIAAQYVHYNSDRANQPFMTLNCIGIAPEKLEYEFFSLLEHAQGGTLLCDEVHAMPLELQGKLLNLLQDTLYKPETSEKINADVRVIATSSEVIEENVNSGQFRKDLYFRLNVIPVLIPALKKRKSQIPQIIEHYSSRSFSNTAMSVLQAYNWPGNIKQLHNVIEWVEIMHEYPENEVGVDDLPPELLNNITPTTSAPKDELQLLREHLMTLSLREARERFERYYLLSQVNKFDGNISKTAEFIGMERSALHRKLKSLDVFSDDKQNVA